MIRYRRLSSLGRRHLPPQAPVVCGGFLFGLRADHSCQERRGKSQTRTEVWVSAERCRSRKALGRLYHRATGEVPWGPTSPRVEKSAQELPRTVRLRPLLKASIAGLAPGLLANHRQVSPLHAACRFARLAPSTSEPRRAAPIQARAE